MTLTISRTPRPNTNSSRNMPLTTSRIPRTSTNSARNMLSTTLQTHSSLPITLAPFKNLRGYIYIYEITKRYSISLAILSKIPSHFDVFFLHLRLLLGRFLFRRRRFNHMLISFFRRLHKRTMWPFVRWLVAFFLPRVDKRPIWLLVQVKPLLKLLERFGRFGWVVAALLLCPAVNTGIHGVRTEHGDCANFTGSLELTALVSFEVYVFFASVFLAVGAVGAYLTHFFDCF